MEARFSEPRAYPIRQVEGSTLDAGRTGRAAGTNLRRLMMPLRLAVVSMQ